MIVLPSWPGARRAVPRVLDFGGILEPSSGAESQRMNRLGNRYGVTFDMPALNSDEGRVWVNRLIRGQTAGARMEYPLLDFNPGTPGAFVVDGNGQAGTLLTVKGGAPGYQFKEGQPFNLIIGGKYYLDFIAADVAANGSGNAIIPLSQMMRAQPSDGAALLITQPVVEGWVVDDQVSWELALNRSTALSFTIHESR
ncbi:hypothetical protein [Sphingomonas bisphenolicum]|uniref:Uncharacterized protein n=1 Tax=Sphingomonas bisphenolicum TaxID=296544 RepID=A0ABM7FYG6_9SPHN|nr:hypothetical protein [Sphingomonas bisphenolicum]BBF70185.1 hypothetical protein SBA_ch1_23850 [Sphingomonas bisphenolicum]